MIFVAVPILLFLILFNIKFAKPKEFFEDVTSHKRTNAINGIFVVIIFLSHFGKCFTDFNVYDTAFYSLPIMFTQLIVVSFLFFSGFGLMESVKKKGQSYVKSIATKRFPKLLLEYASCVLLYVAVQACMGNYYSFGHILLSLIGWVGVGNAYWFIFATFVFYIFMFVSFSIFKDRKNYLFSVLGTTILTIVYIIAMKYILPQDPWNYNTLLCLPAGQFLSLYKDKIINWLKMKKGGVLLATIVVLLAIFIPLYIYCWNNVYDVYTFNILSVIFAFLFVTIGMKVCVYNKILDFLGKHTFWIFILQNLFFNIFSYVGLVGVSTYLYFFVCLASTILCAVLFRIAFSKLENLIWRPKKKLVLQTNSSVEQVENEKQEENVDIEKCNNVKNDNVVVTVSEKGNDAGDKK